MAEESHACTCPINGGPCLNECAWLIAAKSDIMDGYVCAVAAIGGSALKSLHTKDPAMQVAQIGMTFPFEEEVE